MFYSNDLVRSYMRVTNGLMTGGRDDIGHTLVSKETWSTSGTVSGFYGNLD